MEEVLLSTLQTRLKRLTETAKKVKDMNDSLEEGVSLDKLTAGQMALKSTLDQLSEHVNMCLKTLKNIGIDLFKTCQEEQIKAEDLVTEVEVVLKLYTVNKPEKEQQTRLPKLDIGKYSGDILKWTSFWDKFSINVGDRDLPNVVKMSYLLGYLEGGALQVVEGLETTNNNYPIAVSLLKERFGKKNTVVDAHNIALQSLEKAQNTKDCRKTLNTIETHLRVLAAYGEKVDASHLRVLILNKFPEDIIYQVRLFTSEEDSTDHIRQALNKVITASEQSDNMSARQEMHSGPPQVASTSALLKVTQEKNGSRKRKWNDRKEQPTSRKRKWPTVQENNSKRSRMSCVFCKRQHYSEDCTEFKSYKERLERLQKRCFICFRNGHLAAKCFNKRRCPHCQKMHNRALCPLKTVKGKAVPIHTPEIETSINISNRLCNLLQTAVAQTVGQSSRNLACRILLDSGSMRSYISSKLAEELKLVVDKVDDLVIYTFGSNKPDMIKSPSAEVIILTKRQIERKIRVNIVPHITDNVPVANINLREIDILADDESCGQKVDLLIGNDLYFTFIKNNHLKIGDHLYMIDSDFGWLTSGTVSEDSHTRKDTLSVVTYCGCHDANCPYFTEPDLPLRNIDMKFLWALESIGITDSPKTTKEEEAVHHFNENVKYEEGRYQVKWPWVQYPPELPTNYGLALGRLKSLLKRSDEETLDSYSEILREQLEAKVIEIVQPPTAHGSTHPIHFLPHHMVKQKGKRGRIVYDASSKAKDQKSLNECLYRGPSMLEDLTGLILKFRMGKIGITADVEKAFLQVGLQTEDRDVTRFLWVKDSSKEVTEDNIIQYRFCRIPFEILSSPFLLTATIRYHISQTEKRLLPKIADRCYVDNLVTSVDSTEEAIQLYKDTCRIFQELGMNIRDWMSNKSDFIDSIPISQRETKVGKMKVLGLLWNMDNDTLQLNTDPKFFNSQLRGITKKGVLSMLARLYDPCGFASPMILPGKLLFSELCTMKLKWEEKLPDDIQSSWESIVKNLAAVNDIKVPRYVGNTPIDTGDILKYELHGFTDASMAAYATVVYLRVIGKDTTSVSFIMSKLRITPKEDKDELKIPKLELLAFLIGSRLIKYVNDHTELKLSKLYLWTDSQVVLAWMKTSKLLPPFVAKRVKEIKQICNRLGLELRHVKTEDNPADIATRPDVWQHKLDLWFSGPKFLTRGEGHWPKGTQTDEDYCLVGRTLDMVDGPEMVSKGYETLDMIHRPDITSAGYDNKEDSLTPDRQGSSTSPKEIPSGVDRLAKNNITVEEIKRIQIEHFPDEAMGKKTSLSLNLGIFQDVDGLLRSKGRLGHANWPYDKKYPIIIPKKSPLTTQIIRRAHEENYHVGVPHTLSIIREKYWIPQGRAQVQKVIKNCPQCVKYGGGPFQLPPPPALPSVRVNYSKPFSFTGLDYLGPILVETEKGREKRWLCLLTCLAVRAVHLEIVKDLSAKECLLAIRRFTAIRGIPDTIISDNALQFKLTSEILTSEYCVNKGIKWRFIAQLAPWQGGFYERLVALVKHCLKRTLDKHLLTDSQMITVLKEVESVLNTRPLTAVGAEPEEVLRPADFLTLGKCLDFDPVTQGSNQELTNTKVDLIQSWNRGQIILDEYKKMFVNQYLPSLRERPFHTHKQSRVKSTKTPKIGDIVQIKEDSKNRTNWRVGKITTLIKGHDGLVRVAKVKVNDTEFTRSIGHLYPLEADNVDDDYIPETELSQVTEQEDNGKEESISIVRKVSDIVEQPEPAIVVPDSSPEKATEPVAAQIAPIDEVSHIEEDQSTQVERMVPCPASPAKEPEIEDSDTSEKRNAAIKAREKIAEWTRHLMTIL